MSCVIEFVQGPSDVFFVLGQFLFLGLCWSKDGDTLITEIGTEVICDGLSAEFIFLCCLPDCLSPRFAVSQIGENPRNEGISLLGNFSFLCTQTIQCPKWGKFILTTERGIIHGGEGQPLGHRLPDTVDTEA